MEKQSEQSRTQVAVVGTGLAGLTMAYLLENDRSRRFQVSLFEQAPRLSFDSASVSVRNERTQTVNRVDVPMRVMGGGYYPNMMRMYQYLVVCYFWFSLACYCVPPKTSCQGDTNSPPKDETLSQYLARIRLPSRYITHYLLPVVSSASTCSHAEAMNFPAVDVTRYENLSRGQQQYTVCGGVSQVQAKLTSGVQDIRLSSRVVSLESTESQRVIVRWTATNGKGNISEQIFDRVVLAVSPDVAARLYSPLTPALSRIPISPTDCSVLSPETGDSHIIVSTDAKSNSCAHHGSKSGQPQDLTFRTVQAGGSSKTESVHVMPNGVLIRTCPLDPAANAKSVLHSARFVRTLRTVESREVIRKIAHESDSSTLGSGYGNVWVVGSWCWDGLVLLEGCVVSATRVAKEFGVDAPWQSGSSSRAPSRRERRSFAEDISQAVREGRRQLSLAIKAAALP